MTADDEAVDPEPVAEVVQPLSSGVVYRPRVHVVVVETTDNATPPKPVPFDVTAFQADLADANATYLAANVQFDFDPATDVTATNPGLPDCNDATVGAYGDAYLRGKIAVFYCPKRGGGASSAAGSNSIAYEPDTNLAHELGHYLGLGHTFTGDVTLPGVAGMIRKDLQEEFCWDDWWNLGLECFLSPEELAEGFAVRDYWMDGDQLPDTGISLHEHPAICTGLASCDVACEAGMTIPLVVTFDSGQTYNYEVAPEQHNVMGYYWCNPPLALAPSQAFLVRASLESGNRRHLLDGPGVWAPGWESLGGNLGAKPAVLAKANGELHIAQTTSLGHVSTKVGPWWPSQQDWLGLGLRGVSGQPAFGSRASDFLDLVVRKTDGQIYSRTWDPGLSSWWPTSTWLGLGGPLAGTPAMASWGEGRIDLLGRNNQNQVLHKSWTATEGWNPSETTWTTLDGAILGTPSMATRSVGSLDAVAVGLDGRAYYRSKNGNQAWTGWRNLEGQFSGSSTPQIIAMSPTKFFIVGRMLDGELRYKVWDADAGYYPSETGWVSLGSWGIGNPSVASWGAGRLDLVVRGGGDVLYKYWDESLGSAWWPSQTGWAPMGMSGADGEPVVVTTGATKLDVFVRHSDGTLRHRARSR